MEYAIYQGYNRFCTIYFDAVFSDESCIIDPYFLNMNFENVTEIDTGDCLETGLCELAGDLNTDNIIDVLDIVLLVDCILDENVCSCADINADYSLDVTDVIEMVSLIMNV